MKTTFYIILIAFVKNLTAGEPCSISWANDKAVKMETILLEPSDTLWIPFEFKSECNEYRLSKSGGHFYHNDKLIDEQTYYKWKKFYHYACDSILRPADGHYCKFYLKDSIVFEEGLWHIEFFEGPYKAYFENGKKRVIGQFSKDGLRDGIWLFYDRKGKVKAKIQYHEGIEVKENSPVHIQKK